MKNKNKKDENHFSVISEPYKQKETDTMVEFFERYKEDKNAFYEIDGKMYYKALEIWCAKLGDREGLLVGLDSGLNCRIGSVLVDELENEYTVKGSEMIRFSGEIPEWYFKIGVFILTPPYEKTGEYFALKEY